MQKPELKSHYDVAIIGGGIHAVSLAAEAASRGLETLVIQANDIAAGASGGLPCVVSGELQRIAKCNFLDISSTLKDLRIVNKKAPKLVYPATVHLLQKNKLQESRWTKAGIALYKRLFPQNIKPQQLQLPGINTYPYTEFCVNRNRLILAYAHYAADHKADIVNYFRVSAAERNQDEWQLTLQSSKNKHQKLTTRSRVLINSSGWQVSELMSSVIHAVSRCRTTHVVAGRLLIPKPDIITEIVALQRADNTVTYATPINDNLLSIEPIVASDDSQIAQKNARNAFLSEWRDYFPAIKAKDIVYECWTRQAMPEDYADNREGSYGDSLLDLNNPGKAAVLLNVFGLCTGKHRKLAEQALDILQPFTGAARNTVYQTELLPGTEVVNPALIDRLKSEHPHISPDTVHRLAITYGNDAEIILKNKKQKIDLGHHFSAGLYAAEVNYLIEREWVQTAEDILWRRTALGLNFNSSQIPSLNDYINHHLTNLSPVQSAISS